ncbi:hypothetical protein WAE58_21850 [Pedobacter panaciterrae]|uniref:Bacteriophage holin family protein n=1 Tax=Pedobacter panaciterrae TaxID=363849 RepID=A0ABU8NS61_9SPHI
MKRLFCEFILVGDHSVGLKDRFIYMGLILIKIAPFAFVLDLFNWWIKENKQFGTFICIALLLNMIVGLVTHIKNNSFNFPSFLGRNAIMIFVVCVVYVMLEMLRYTAGNNIIGEVFKILIQVTTLMYPTSKVFKNCYILSNGKYPPEFIMQRLYNFEKNGDLNAFFKTKSNENENNITD